MADSKRFQAKNGLDNNSKTIINVLDPVNNTDAVNLQYANAAYQSKDADLTAIATLSDDETGLLKKTAPNTWQLFTGTTLADYGITDAVSSSLLGAANGVATLGPDGTLNSSQIPAALLGSVSYKGVWNASINTPTIPIASSTNKGWYYKISVAGTTDIDGISDWQMGDWIISNGTTWDKIDNTDLVSSVNGLTGAVTLTTTNIAEGTQLYFTEARVRNTPLTGYSIGSTYTLSATDTVLQAFNKLSFGVVSAHDAITRTKKYHGMFYNAVTKEYDTTLSYTLATRTLTISPTGASYKIFVDGTQYTFASPQNIQHAATEGGWFIYYNTSGVLTASQTTWNLLSDIPVAYVYYDATTPDFLLLDERHHHTSDKEWHNSQHFAYGTYVKNSTDFVLGNYTIGTSSNAAVTWSLGSGTVVDEDIQTLVSAVADGGPYQTWHKSGASGAWRRIQRSVPYHFNSGTNWAQYNAFTGGSWQLVDMANNQYTNYYIFAVPSLDTTRQIIIVPSQTVYTSESDAESEGLASLDLTGFPSQEFVGVWKLVLRTDVAGGASGQAQIRRVVKLASSRASVTSGGFSPTVHNSLLGRSDADTHPASSITNTPFGNIVATNAQAAINELDSEKGGLSLNNSWTGSNTFTQALTALQFVKSGGTSSQFLKADGSVDSSVYLTSNQTITISGDASGSGTTAITLALSDTGVTDALLTNYVVGSNTALAATDTVLQAFQKVQGQLNSKQPSGSYQPLDADLTAIAGLAGTSGLLRKTAADTWSLDTNTYLTSNQTITISGDASGSGTTAITLSLSDTGVTDALLTNYTVGTNTALAATDTVLQAFQKVQGQINNRQPLDADLTSIAGLAGTSGLLRKTAADTWSLDTTSYEPAISTGTTSQYYRGDKTWQALDTAAVTESTNLYFTNARVLGTVLTGLNTSLTGAVADSDTILAALGKLENRVAGFSASVVSSFNTRTGAVTLTSGDVTGALGFSPSPDTHTHTFASLTSKPTTLSGYGITDASSSSHNHDGVYAKLSGADFTGLVRLNEIGANVITSYLTTGASDGNFRLISANGVGTTADSEQAWLGLAYGSTRLAGISFIRGGDVNAGIQFTTGSANTTALTLGIDGTATFAGIIKTPGIDPITQTLDLSGLDQNTYYPVTIVLPANRPVNLKITTVLGSSSVPTWATHGSGFSLTCAWAANGSAWGTQHVQRTIHTFEHRWANQNPVGGITQMLNSSTEVIYLRGGGIYYFHSDVGVTATLRTTTYSASNESVSPTTSIINDCFMAATAKAAFGRIRFNDSIVSGGYNNYIQAANAYYWRLGSDSGYVDIGNGNGPGSTSWLHFFTDRNGFYFGRKIATPENFQLATAWTGLTYPSGNAAITVADYGNYWNVISGYGLLLRDQSSTIKGQLYFDASGFGLLNSLGDWGVRCNPGASGGGLFGNWNCTGNLSSYGVVESLGGRSISINGALGAIKLKSSAGGWAEGMFMQNRSSQPLGVFGFFGSADTLAYHYIGGTYDSPLFKVTQSTGVEVKGVNRRVYFDTTGVESANWIGSYGDSDLRLYNGRGSTAYFDIRSTGTIETGSYIHAPSFVASSWFRSTGTSGWYNETYSTGIYATAQQEVRTYNGSRFVATQLEAESNGTSGGIILRNPSGTRYRLSVNASNQLQLDAI